MLKKYKNVNLQKDYFVLQITFNKYYIPSA